MSTPHSPHEPLDAARARAASWRTRCRHGASQPETIHTVAPMPIRNTLSGNQAPKRPLRWGEPRRCSPSRPLAISRPANRSVKGWSASSRFTQSAAQPNAAIAASASARPADDQEAGLLVARQREVLPPSDEQDQHRRGDRACRG